MADEFINIREAAESIGVTIMTLRRWDESGKLVATRTEGGHRLYRKQDIDIYLKNLMGIAREWVSSKDGAEEIPQEFYCSIHPIFQARLDRMAVRLKTEIPGEMFSLLGSIAGEIGNNSFDHNLGNWPDVPGVLFGYDQNKKEIVLADRGLGILETLKRVRPHLASDEEALKVAFTEVVSGREPENRGNGLKYVRRIVKEYPINLFFKTGNANLILKSGDSDLHITTDNTFIRGCLALITF